jgi:hypothetical protein
MGDGREKNGAGHKGCTVRIVTRKAADAYGQ